jgi:UDP-glucose 4-epimerase
LAITTVPGDLGDSGSYGAFPRKIGTLVHLAAASSDIPGVQKVADLNVRGTSLLLDYARRAGAERVIFASSMTVYGDIASPIVDENTDIVNPGAYGMSKRLGELMLADISDDLPSISLRLPAVLGPGAERHWPARVVAAARKGGPVRLYNPESPFNNVIDVSSLAAFIAELCRGGWSGAQAFPVCCSGTLTVAEAARTILDGLGADADIETSTAAMAPYVINAGKANALGLRAAGVKDALAAFAAGEMKDAGCVH